MRTPYDHSTYGCLNKILRGVLQESFDRGKWSREEKHFHINFLELLASKSAILVFTKNLSHLKLLWHISWIWVVPEIHNPNQQDNLELSTISSDHNYCRVPFKQIECQSRLRVQECNRLIWLETSSEWLSENNQTLRNHNSRSVSYQAVLPTSSIYGMKVRSK